MFFYNRITRKELKSKLSNEEFVRKTISVYRYFIHENPLELRGQLYQEWIGLNCFGRIYTAREGINAQMSLPKEHLEIIFQGMKKYPTLDQISVNYTIEDAGKSFYKLSIKVRPKLVADVIISNSFDITNVGKHLSAEEFHELVDSEDNVVVDMRNHYESEIGHFTGTNCPEVDTFREEITLISEMLAHQKDLKILLYCTGEIRCEKASAYL